MDSSIENVYGWAFRKGNAMIILGVDPGDVMSGFCFFNADKLKTPGDGIRGKGKVENLSLIHI